MLGNGYLKRFFNISHDKSDLKKAFNAYNQSLADPSTANHPDVHYNRAIIHEYLDEYQRAFDGYLKSASLDPAQFGLQERIQEIFQYLDQAYSALNSEVCCFSLKYSRY